MKRPLPVYTLACYGLALAAIPLIVLHWTAPAVLVALLGYMVVMKDFSKHTSPLQFVAVLFSATVAGVALSWPIEGVPWMLIAIFLAAFATIGRIMFFRFFGYTSHSWFDVSLLILSVCAHAAGNLLYQGNWMSWILPLPFIVFAGVIVWGIVKDKKQLLGSTLNGYKVGIGTEAPDFSLPDQNGELVNISNFRGGRNLLLIFVRGDWCPGCHMMLRTYQRESKRFAEKNVFVMSIGPDPVGVNREMVERLGLDFKVLADEGQRTAMTYGVQLQEYDNAFAEKYDEGIPLPASFLIDKKGIVRYVSRPDRVGEFLNPSLIFPILDNLES